MYVPAGISISSGVVVSEFELSSLLDVPESVDAVESPGSVLSLAVPLVCVLAEDAASLSLCVDACVVDASPVEVSSPVATFESPVLVSSELCADVCADVVMLLSEPALLQAKGIARLIHCRPAIRRIMAASIKDLSLPD